MFDEDEFVSEYLKLAVNGVPANWHRYGLNLNEVNPTKGFEHVKYIMKCHNTVANWLDFHDEDRKNYFAAFGGRLSSAMYGYYATLKKADPDLYHMSGKYNPKTPETYFITVTVDTLGNYVPIEDLAVRYVEMAENFGAEAQAEFVKEREEEELNFDG